MTYTKKLIEVALPLEAINAEALRRKQKAPKGWPSSFHKWWAQRPVASARAVIFAQMVDDPSSLPDLFPTVKEQDAERARLFKLIEELVLWDNTGNSEVLARAQAEIWSSWRRACMNIDIGMDKSNLFDPNVLPAFCDPFAGGGTLPLSAQWLGLESYAMDLNPVAVLINKALIDIPCRFTDRAPTNPDAHRRKMHIDKGWKGAQGLAEDVRYYSMWMRTEAQKRLGHLYPNIEITKEMTKSRPDLRAYEGQSLTVTTWLWARTVISPNPAFSDIHVPLASTFMLSSKLGKEVYVEPLVEAEGYSFKVKVGKPNAGSLAKDGTKVGRGGHFRCLMSGSPIPVAYIREQGIQGTLGARLMAVVAEGTHGRVYLDPDLISEQAALSASPSWIPDQDINYNPRDIRTQLYGLLKYGDLFTSRQLAVLTCFSDLVLESVEQVKNDAVASGLNDDGISLRHGGYGATAYAEAISTYLACVLDRMVYYGSSLTSWLPKDNALRDCMPRQALAMTWDFAECNPFGKSSGDVLTCANSVANYLDVATPSAKAYAEQCDAQTASMPTKKFVFSTDPPYYDNIGYADLSDFFYVWLRRSIRPIFPELFSTLAVPKSEELVATPYRHGSKEKAEVFFLDGMTEAMQRLAEQTHPAFPVTIYYAFKQSESDEDDGTTNTGWDTFLGAVIRAGFSITGTWPMRTEGAGRMIAFGTNALASSIVLVCRPRSERAATVTRREFAAALKSELPFALAHLQAGNIAPVDLAQAAIGPGMAVFSRFKEVIDAEGKTLSVRTALTLINQTLDEALAEQEGDFDADTRWALIWFEQSGFSEGEYGTAEQLSKSKNTAVSGLVEANIISSKAGKVRLLKPFELHTDWDPSTDSRLTVWEMVHQLIRVFESGGESAAASLVSKLGSKAETARELCYRLYTLCERKKRAVEAMAYNSLVQSWPEINRLASLNPSAVKLVTTDMFEQE